jgi:hypothetical protein
MNGNSRISHWASKPLRVKKNYALILGWLIGLQHHVLLACNVCSFGT